jgi:sigma-B regulation protein RsbU (phosphoserine phosphatase)
MDSSTPTSDSTIANTGQRVQHRAGMACLDTSGSTRLPILMEMVGSLSRATEPNEVVRTFSKGLRKLNGPWGYVSLSTRGLEPGHYRITRLINDDEIAHIDEGDPWRNMNELPVHSGGFFGEIIRQAFPEIIHNFFLRGDPVVGDALAGYGSMMAIPLFDHGEPLNWSIVFRRDPEGFSIEDLEESVLQSNLVGSTVRNVLAAKELREAHNYIRQEVEQIASIQRALLPKQTPQIPGVKVATSYEVYDVAGGDYYDFFPLGTSPTGGRPSADEPWDGPWGVLIADAAGHGPAAAVLMAMLHAILHAYPRVPEDPAEVLRHANEHLTSKGIASSYITALFAIYDPSKRSLTYARAGHPPPLLKNPGAGGAVRRLDDVGSVPLGLMPDVEFENATIMLESDQTLVLYTDGITEAMSPDRTMFGVNGIEAALERCTGEPKCVQDSVTDALLEHEGGVRPSDDQTIVAIRVDGEEEGTEGPRDWRGKTLVQG